MEAKEQIALGFPRLKFKAPLEHGFQAAQRTDELPRLRLALLAALFAVGSLLLVDVMMGGSEPGFSATRRLSAVCLGSILILLAGSFARALQPYLRPTATVASVLLTLVALASFKIDGIPMSPIALSCFLLLTIYVYLLLTPPFMTAVAAGIGILLAVTGFSIWSGNVQPVWPLTALLLLLANLLGAACLYRLEFQQRRHFLEARLSETQARTDNLTGIANRDYFLSHFAKVWAACQRDELPLCLAAIDIDQFRNYNKQYGHQAGDECLRKIATAMQETCRRPNDLVARYGGEEFILMLTGSNLDHAHLKLSDLLAKIEGLNITHAGASGSKRVTASAGLAHLHPHETERTAEDLLKLAQAALDTAKQKGRNRVVVSHDGRERNLATGIFQLMRTGQLTRLS